MVTDKHATINGIFRIWQRKRRQEGTASMSLQGRRGVETPARLMLKYLLLLDVQWKWKTCPFLASVDKITWEKLLQSCQGASHHTPLQKALAIGSSSNAMSVCTVINQQGPNASRSTWSVFRLVARMKPRNCSSLIARMNLALNDSGQRITTQM